MELFLVQLSWLEHPYPDSFRDGRVNGSNPLSSTTNEVHMELFLVQLGWLEHPDPDSYRDGRVNGSNPCLPAGRRYPPHRFESVETMFIDMLSRKCNREIMFSIYGGHVITDCICPLQKGDVCEL